MATTWARCPKCGELRSLLRVGDQRMCVSCANKLVVPEVKAEVRK